MKERPILFSGPMVRAILEGRKTQTRRVIKPQPYVVPYNDAYGNAEDATFWRYPEPKEDWPTVKNCPYGRPAEHLWVRETWQYFDWTEDGEPFIRYAADNHFVLKRVNSDEWGEKIWDIFCDLSAPENFNIDRRASDRRWRPSIHMPRWASRITMRITDIRVERLQDISEEDAMAEGAELVMESNNHKSYREGFYEIWAAVNGSKSWHDNPWVWVVKFEKID